MFKILEFKERYEDEENKYETSAFITTTNGLWIAHFCGEPEWTLESPSKKYIEFKRNYDWENFVKFLFDRKEGSVYTTYEGDIIQIKGKDIHIIGHEGYSEEYYNKFPHMKEKLGYYSSVEDLFIIVNRLLMEYW